MLLHQLTISWGRLQQDGLHAVPCIGTHHHIPLKLREQKDDFGLKSLLKSSVSRIYQVLHCTQQTFTARHLEPSPPQELAIRRHPRLPVFSFPPD